MLLKIKNNFFGILLAIALMFAPMVLLAAQGNPNSAGGSNTCDPATEICNPITQDTIQDFLLDMLQGIIKILIPVIALAIIYAGFLFVTARGNPQELNKAKSALLYSVIGAAILLGAWALAQLISETVLQLNTP